MFQQDLEGIRARLDRVERRQRLIAAGWVLTVAAFVFLFLIERASTESQFIETHGVKVVDRQGRKALLLGLNDEGLPGIWVYRPGETNWVIHLGVSGTTPVATLQDAGATLDLGFTSSLPGLWYRDMSGARRLAIDFLSGNPEIVLYDKAKRIMWQTP